MDRKLRVFLTRAVAILLFILLGVWMFFIGKQHTILIDNKTVDEYAALDMVEVSIDGEPSIEVYKRMRDQFVVTGQTHTLTLTYVDDSWNEITLEKKIKVPLNENMVLLSLPVLIADPEAPQETWLEPFAGLAVSVDTGSDEVVLTEEASLMSDF